LAGPIDQNPDYLQYYQCDFRCHGRLVGSAGGGFNSVRHCHDWSLCCCHFRSEAARNRRADRSFQKLEVLNPKVINFLPDFGNWSIALSIFIIPIFIQWWSVWYPGAEPGGGSYIAQRMLAAKSEKDALSGTLFFNFAHYAIRPWPWILVALCSFIIYPNLSDISQAFPTLIPG